MSKGKRKDKLLELMEKYRNGEMTESTLAEILRLMQVDEDNRWARSMELIEANPDTIDMIVDKDEYISSVRSKSLFDVVKMLGTVLSEREMEVLRLYAVEGMTMEAIAARCGTYKMEVSRMISSIRSKCMDNAELLEEAICVLSVKAVESSMRNSRKDAGSAKHKVAYPSEFLCQISAEPKWYKQKMILKTKCVLPEYLQHCFGDGETKCTMCMGQFGENDCSRKAVN